MRGKCHRLCYPAVKYKKIIHVYRDINKIQQVVGVTSRYKRLCIHTNIYIFYFIFHIFSCTFFWSSYTFFIFIYFQFKWIYQLFMQFACFVKKIVSRADYSTTTNDNNDDTMCVCVYIYIYRYAYNALVRSKWLRLFLEQNFLVWKGASDKVKRPVLFNNIVYLYTYIYIPA